MQDELIKKLPTKESLIQEALKYDKRGKKGYLIVPSTAYGKGLRRSIQLCLPFIMDLYKKKIEELIK